MCDLCIQLLGSMESKKKKQPINLLQRLDSSQRV
jgi:hypothetical protein